MHPLNIPTHLSDDLASQVQAAERLSRARVEQARRELDGIGSAAEAETLARVRLEGDLGQILAQPTMTDARLMADDIAAGAEAATQAAQRGQELATDGRGGITARPMRGDARQAARDGADSYDALNSGELILDPEDDHD